MMPSVSGSSINNFTASTVGVPIIGSKEIPWSTRFFNADPTDSDNIADVMLRTHQYAFVNVWKNQRNLDKYTQTTKDIWIDYFKGD